MKRTIYHLKPRVKRIIFIVIVIIIFISAFIKTKYDKYQEYLYMQTCEYKILNLNYSESEEKTICSSLNDQEVDEILKYNYNEFIPQFVDKKYFIFNNLDKYLEQVITQDDDFFKYHGTSGYDYDKIIASVNTHTSEDYYSLDLNADTSLDKQILVNKYYKLDSTYKPDDLVDIDVKYYYGEKKQIRSEVYDAFLNMWNSAYESDIYLVIVSAFRDYDSQVSTYNSYEKSRGTKYADSIAARPGYSEHQTGLSLDIYSKANTSRDTFDQTETYQWLINNCYKFGFILRYPKDKEDITGYNYESWHYRYVGVEIATKIHDEGITYDEYYAYYIENKENVN